jgi:cysteine desulfurase family protein (TIGR01976 family)
MTPSITDIRSRFPALQQPLAFLENAGGSQVPECVPDAISAYMRENYVQLGAQYPLSTRADRVVKRAHAFSETFVGGRRTGKAILGPSSSQLCAMLAQCYAEILEPGDNVVIVDTGHEANIGPWAQLAKHGVEVRTWCIDPETLECPLDALDDLLDERTRVVAVVQVSNLLGEVVDLAPISERAHAVGARVVADGVAFAPHRAVDVAALGVDWYAFSTYKVYGPHMAVLWGRNDAIAELTGPNHFFVPRDDVPYKFELGGVNHEGCAGWLAVGQYLSFLAGREPGSPVDRSTIVDAFSAMQALEEPLTARLVEYLLAHPRLRVIGATTDDRERVPTVSFIHESMPSSQIVAACHEAGIAVRNGHMYARRLCEPLGLDPDEGAVRVSALHYNTLDEIERVIAVLDGLA